ncbi:Mth938-like domain-containing protein [Roseitranquillus sediminis]|uniref:Mth938-like domain-containing protein n=1 Tax=Roseitranquillus sediminis TaxID=2809051 RepID=UPI001D0C46C5|nr:Mth938-like domain-containing protein [Roseitranquillus sediminis]MBM9594923.1 Mth938-like domain-containing protein [Roseitranquillus sediminis]
MRLNEVTYTGALPIDGYGPGFFRIAGTVHAAPLAVLPSGVTRWGGYDDLAPLLDLAEAMDILFLGTGAEPAHPPRAFREAVEAAGMGLEVMASPPACRTYNVLLSEGRRVGIALMPV